MNRRFFLFSGIAGLAIVAGGSFAALSLPETEASTASPIDAEEHARAIAALAPPKRSRPVVAIIAGSRGGETTDFLVPFGVLSRSQVADVRALAIREGPLPLMPARHRQVNERRDTTRRMTAPGLVIWRAKRRRSRPRPKMPWRGRLDDRWLRDCCGESGRDWRPGRGSIGTSGRVAVI